MLLLRGGRLVELTVTTGMSNWQYAEVRSGVSVGDEVVVVRDSPDIKAGARARAKGTR